MESLDKSTVALVDKFLASGGTVLSFVDPPKLVDGVAAEAVTSLATKYAARWKRLNRPEDLKVAGVASLALDATPGGKLFHLRRKLDGGDLLFLVNTSLDANASGSFKASGRLVQRLDTMSGEFKPYPGHAAGKDLAGAKEQGPKVNISFDLPPAGSLLLYVSQIGAVTNFAGLNAPKPATETPVDPAGPLTVHALSPNILKIDYLDLKLAGKETKGVYFFKAQEDIFKHYGFTGNPWLSTTQFKTEILDKDHFPEDSGFEASFAFNVATGRDAERDAGGGRAALVMEGPGQWGGGQFAGRRDLDWTRTSGAMTSPRGRT